MLPPMVNVLQYMVLSAEDIKKILNKLNQTKILLHKNHKNYKKHEVQLQCFVAKNYSKLKIWAKWGVCTQEVQT